MGINTWVQHQCHADGGKRTLIIEAVADHSGYIWYSNFGNPGSMNDLNVLDRSSIVDGLISGELDISTDPYDIDSNGHDHDWMYFLVDGIYPEWAIFVDTFSNKDDPKRGKFAARQERVRKDIECAFGVLVSRFHILDWPIWKNWYLDDIKDLLDCCIILHNMIVEARNGKLSEEEAREAAPMHSLVGREAISAEVAALKGIDLWAARVAAFDSAMRSIFNPFQLKQDLIEYIFKNFDN